MGLRHDMLFLIFREGVSYRAYLEVVDVRMERPVHLSYRSGSLSRLYIQTLTSFNLLSDLMGTLNAVIIRYVYY